MTAPADTPRVLVCARPAIGGAARVIDALLRGLPARGLRGTAALSGVEGTGLIAVAEQQGWDVERVDLERELNPWRDARAALRIRRLLPGHDLVHAHASKAGALARLTCGGRRRGPPVVYTPHGFYFSYHEEGSKEWNRFLGYERRLAPLTTLLHCVSESERDLALRLGLATEENCVVLRNPVPPRRQVTERAAILERLGIHVGQRVVFMAARLAPPKDPVTYVEAAARMASADVVFMLAGTGPLLEDARTAAESGGAAVRFIEDETDVRGVLSVAEVAVLASGSEALPVFLLEALAESVPVVATDLPGCREAAGEAALYVPAGDPAAMAETIDRLLLDADLHERLAARAAERAKLFDEVEWLNGLLSLYRRAAELAA